MKSLRVDARVAAELNRSMVYDVLRSRRVISRASLARETGLSKGTISQIVEGFLRDGLISSGERGESAKGRRPTLLHFLPRARFAIGVELLAGEAAITDLDGSLVRLVVGSRRFTDAPDALASAVELVESVLAETPLEKLVGIGVGTPGLVDSHSGIVRLAPDLGWRDVPVGPVLADRFPVPIAVINRAKAAAVGEAWSAGGHAVDSLVYISVSTGIAAGMVIDGRLYRGVSQSEGELGHVTILPNGPLCGCGNRGCLQTLAAGPAILARARERLRRTGALHESASRHARDFLTLEDLAMAEANGVAVANEVLDETAEYLGLAAANLVNLLNPRVLVLGGPVIRALPTLVPRVRAVVARRAMSVPASAVQVIPSALGHAAVPVGAAAYLLAETSVIGGSRPAQARRIHTASIAI